MNERQRPSIDGEEIAIVLIGDFNAKIFQPSWFALEELIRRSEAEQAEVEIVHRDVSVFRLEWCSIEVTRDRFLARTMSLAHRTALRDLAAGAFSKLCHTPTRQLGINLTQRLRFASDAEWHNYGHFLAPKSPWKGLLKKPGMLSIRLQGQREDGAEGHVLVTVEPSKPGHVSAKVTDHFEAPKDAPGQATPYFIDIIESGFDKSLERAQHIISGSIDGFTSEEDFDGGTD